MCAAVDWSQRIWPDYEDLPRDVIGYHVRCRSNWVLVQPDVSSVSKAVGTFLGNVGIKSAEAAVVPIGSTSGGPGLIEGIDPVAKLLGHVVTVVKLALAWRARVTSLVRRRLRPPVTVTLLADHVPLHRETADTYFDTASLIVSLLPELLRELQESHPSFNISIHVRARGVKAEKVDIRVGNGLDLTDQHVMKILKWLKGATTSMTVRHVENWLSFPTVKQIKGKALTARQFSGEAMMGGG
jgi:hypothetical protein